MQELVGKAQELPEDIQWHFIGMLQSNKAKTLVSSRFSQPGPKSILQPIVFEAQDAESSPYWPRLRE